MSNYPYKFEKYAGPRSRYTCPNCGHRHEFTRYIDIHTGEYVADETGICNRKIQCGYHYHPNQYFKDKGIYIPHEIAPSNGTLDVTNEVVSSIINPKHLRDSLRPNSQNNFIRFLKARFPAEVIDSAIDKYKIGTSYRWDGATVFWQIDVEGNIRSGKIMLYDAISGKRVKKPIDHISWMHKHLNLSDFHLEQCLFGEHLLTQNPEQKVCVVESEKTAIISSIYDAGCTWVSVGGVANLNTKFCKALKGRDVLLFPDGDGYNHWLLKSEELKAIAKVKVCDLLDTELSKEEKEQGFDLADYLLPVPYHIN